MTERPEGYSLYRVPIRWRRHEQLETEARVTEDPDSSWSEESMGLEPPATGGESWLRPANQTRGGSRVWEQEKKLSY